jgi:hypothetical protein
MKKFLLACLVLFFPEWIQAQPTRIVFRPFPTEDFRVFIENIINLIFTISLPLVVVMLVFAAILIVTAAGNQAQIESGKKFIIYTLIGLTIVLMSKGIVALIGYLIR